MAINGRPFGVWMLFFFFFHGLHAALVILFLYLHGFHPWLLIGRPFGARIVIPFFIPRALPVVTNM
jgi:hypothetical protein